MITQLKTPAKDGYDAAQIGLVEFVKNRKMNKPMARTFRQAQCSSGASSCAKFRWKSKQPADGDGRGVKAGDRVLVDIFDGESFVDIVGTSKGRGFAGVVRRHDFGGGPKSHGSDVPDQGSIGASAFPSRVFPGHADAGSHGRGQVTVRNLGFAGIDTDENLLMVEGAVPGPKDGYLVITKAKKPPRERRGFAGAAHGRSVEGFQGAQEG